MAFNVRVFAHRGLEQMPRLRPMQHSEDSVYQLSQPPEWAQLLVADAAPIASAPIADVNNGAAVTILSVEVPDAQAIRYRINPPGVNTAADTLCPKMSGVMQFYFRSGFSISIIDASSLP